MLLDGFKARNKNRVGKSHTFGVCRNSPIPVSTQSSRHEDELCLLLRRKPAVGSPGKLERMRSLSPLLFFSFFSLSFSLQFSSPTHRIVWSNNSSGRFHHATCLPLIGSFDFTLPPYPNLWIFILLGGDTCPTWVP